MREKHAAYLYVRIALVIAAVCLSVFWGTKKEGYHIDELYSYGLANSEYLPYMHFGQSGYDVKDWMMDYGPGENLADLFQNVKKDFEILQKASFHFKETQIYADYLVAQKNSQDTYSTTWVDGEDYKNYLMPSSHNRFNYASVYYNQRGDVHPPLFYLLLHTICSIASGTFSKWYGIGLNVVIMGMALWVLYGMAKRRFGGNVTALSVCIAWAFSACYVTESIFIRMYALLTLAALTFLEVHLAFHEKNFEWSPKMRRWIILSALFGYFTHYYFVIFAIFVALVTGITLVIRKNRGILFRYVGTLSVSALIGLIVWPFSIKHVFLGYRGQSSIASVTSGSYSVYKLQVIRTMMTEALFGGWQWIIFLILAVALGMMIITRRFRIPVYKTCLLIIPMAGYLIIVSQMIPFFSDRYFACFYPVILLLIVSAVEYEARFLRLKAERVRCLPVICTTILLFMAGNAFLRQPGEIYPGGIETVNVPEKTDAVYVLPDGDWNEANSDLAVMSKTRRVGIVYVSNLAALSDYEPDEGTTLMVCVKNGLDRDAVIDAVKRALNVPGFEEYGIRVESTFTRVYLQEKK